MSAGLTPSRRFGRAPEIAAGSAAGLVVAVWLLRWLRPSFLFSLDPGVFFVWFPAWGLLLAATALAFFSGRLLLRAARARGFSEPLLPFEAVGGTRALATIAILAFAAGAAARLGGIDTVPYGLYPDDVTLIRPALDLRGGPRDLARPLRAAPFGVDRPFGTVGLGYLEPLRASLLLAGTNAVGLRLPATLAGVASLATAALLARELLPRGGAVLAVLSLAGLRWALLVVHWGWNAVFLGPILDLAAILAARAARRDTPALAAAAGAVAGLGAHVYLASWIGAAGLAAALAIAPATASARRRFAAVGSFLAALAAVAMPLFLAKGGADPPYFARAGAHNVLREVRLQGSLMPLLAVSADGLAAPWLVPDPNPFAEIPGRNRLGPVGGLCFAAALVASLLRPRSVLHAYLLGQLGAAWLAAVAQGESGHPNGYRYAYLVTPAVIGIAAGALRLAGATPPAKRRVAGLLLLGGISLESVLGVRDAHHVWPALPSTWSAFRSDERRVAEAAARWRALGAVSLSPDYPDDAPMRTLRTLLEARFGEPPSSPVAGGRDRVFVVAPGATACGPGFRSVEVVQDPSGRGRARVCGRRRGPTGPISPRT